MKGHNPYFRTLSVLAVCAALALVVMALAAMTFAAPDYRAVPAELSAGRSGQPSSPLTGHWVVVNSPNVGTGSNSLASVAGNSANDVTAVGSYFDSSSHELTLIEHWNGTAWSVVPSQNPDPNLNRLNSVSSNMSGGYWAAGLSFNATYGSLIEEQATAGASWTLVTVPSVSGFPSLTGISADSPTDAWAVGDYNGGSPNYYQQTLVMHWNGTAWSQVTSPNPGAAHNYLTGVAAVDVNNMWAVGYTNTPPSTNFSPITIHCNSTLTCTAVPFPMAGTSAQLRAISGRLNGPSVQLFASGYYTDGSGTHAYVGYGDGTNWSLINPSQAYVLNGIYAPLKTIPGLAPGSVIAAGDDETPGHTQIVPSSVISPYPGVNWQSYPPVVVGAGTTLFFGVGGAPGSTLWGVGYSAGTGGEDQTLAEDLVPCPGSLQDSCQTPTPTPMQAPPTFTPTLTPTASPTCADSNFGGFTNGGFESGNLSPWVNVYSTTWSIASDNPAAGRYYARAQPSSPHGEANLIQQHIQLPNGPSTLHFSRSQDANTTLSVYIFDEATHDSEVLFTGSNATDGWQPVVVEIPQRYQGHRVSVLVSAKAPGSPSGYVRIDEFSIWTVACPTATPAPCRTADCVPSFSDVQPGSTFYPFVTDLTRLGAISGYPDGTFRPNNPVTRGQLSKIAWLATGALAVLDPAQQTFTDVPPGSTFWADIEPLAGLGLISGYTCGGTGEPCDPLHRPYFRPNTQVTRGQVAKIVDGAGGLELRNPPTPSFSDVPPGSPFYTYIETAVCYGVLSGYSDGTFRPGAPATRGQTSKIVDNGVVQPLQPCAAPTATPR